MITVDRAREIRNIVEELWIQDKNLSDICKNEWIKLTITKFSLNLSEYKDLSWFIYNSNWSYNIIANSDCSDERLRFTISHELWHYFLHKNELLSNNWNIIKDVLKRDPSFPEDDKEYEANEFAWNLLMPEKEFLLDIEKYTISEVAKKYFVSENAVSTRIYYINKYKNV